MQGEQSEAQHFLGNKQMADVGAIVVRTAGARTPFNQGAPVGAKGAASHLHGAVGGEGGPMTPHARGHHAIEEIDTSTHAFHQVVGKADPHEVARNGAWKLWIADLQGGVHVWLRLADGESTHRDAVPLAALQDAGDGRPAEFGVHAPLHDGEECLFGRHEIGCRMSSGQWRSIR